MYLQLAIVSYGLPPIKPHVQVFIPSILEWGCIQRWGPCIVISNNSIITLISDTTWLVSIYEAIGT